MQATILALDKAYNFLGAINSYGCLLTDYWRTQPSPFTFLAQSLLSPGFVQSCNILHLYDIVIPIINLVTPLNLKKAGMTSVKAILVVTISFAVDFGLPVFWFLIY